MHDEQPVDRGQGGSSRGHAGDPPAQVDAPAAELDGERVTVLLPESGGAPSEREEVAGDDQIARDELVIDAHSRQLLAPLGGRNAGRRPDVHHAETPAARQDFRRQLVHVVEAVTQRGLIGPVRQPEPAEEDLLSVCQRAIVELAKVHVERARPRESRQPVQGQIP